MILSPFASRREDLERLALDAPMVTSLLLMVHSPSPLLSSKLQRTIPVSSLSSTAAFTVAVPLPFAVRTPFSETVTMDSSLLCHVILCAVRRAGHGKGVLLARVHERQIILVQCQLCRVALRRSGSDIGKVAGHQTLGPSVHRTGP